MSTKITKTLRFDTDLIKKAEILASQDKRSLNNWLEVLIEKEVKSNAGRKPLKDKPINKF